MNEGYQILAQSLSSEQRHAFQFIKGAWAIYRTKISAEAFVILRELGLVRVVEEEDDGREIVELTQKGRKVAEFL